MGLRFYRNPDEVDAEDAAAKLDRAAAQRRSTIRREASIRPGRDQSSSAGLTNIIRSRHESTGRQARIRAQYDRQEADAQIEVLEAELDRLRRLRRRTTSRISEERTRRRLEQQIEDDLNTVEAGLARPRHVYLTSGENESSSNTPSSSNGQILLPRPTRESNLRFEVAANTSTDSTSPQPQPTFMPSPPHSLSDAGRGRPVDGPIGPWDSTPALTEGFAPARTSQDERNDTVDAQEATSEFTRIINEHDRPGLETPPPDGWEHLYPPLRRVPRMSPRPLPRPTVDGLGDRHRSPSPSSDFRGEENWNHLLSTMDNSPVAPSTSTSFASVDDLMSSSRTASYLSSNTQNSSTSFGEIGTTADDTCDLPPGITEEDVRLLRERHRRTAGRVTAPQRPLLDLSAAVPRRIGANGSDLSPDSPLSILIDEAREARQSQDRQRRRDELLMLHAIAERQQNNHEDIPDEWWALAGLGPGLARSRNDS